MSHDCDRRNFLAVGCAGGLTVLTLAPAVAAPRGKFELQLTNEEWRKRLSPARYRVLRGAATETPHSSPLNKERRRGAYTCAGCALPLFSSATKFDSRTGWPSFFRPLPRAIVTRIDRSLNPERVEVLCRRCGGHLGHVFRDGPRPTGLRYCMNGLALQFVPS